jgi:alpha-mannosidase
VPVVSFATVEGGLVLDRSQRAEDADELVLRLYEPYGGRGVARVRIVAGSARRANLLEDDGEELAVEDGAIVIPFRPREVITVKVAR